MRLRGYEETDAAGTLAVFTRAVRVTASRYYNPQQIDAWANDDRDVAEWHRVRAAANTQVAEIDGRPIGFIDVSPEGYINMLFVDPDHLREGVASTLLHWADATAREAGAIHLSTHASIAARPFFEEHGFVVDEECTPIIRGIALTNYHMTFTLDEPAPHDATEPA